MATLMDALPYEVLAYLFGEFLDLGSLVACRAVCRAMRDLVADPYVFQRQTVALSVDNLSLLCRPIRVDREEAVAAAADDDGEASPPPFAVAHLSVWVPFGDLFGDLCVPGADGTPTAMETRANALCLALQHLTSLKTLSVGTAALISPALVDALPGGLVGFCTSGSGHAGVAPALGRLSRLDRFAWEFCRVTGDIPVASFGSLTRLIIPYGNGDLDAVLDALVHAPCAPTLRALNVDGASWEPGSVWHEYLPGLPCLEELAGRFERNQAADAVVEALGRCPRLRIVSLDTSSHLKADVEALVAALPQLVALRITSHRPCTAWPPSLRHLDVVGDSADRDLIQRLQASGVFLASLRAPTFTNSAVRALAGWQESQAAAGGVAPGGRAQQAIRVSCHRTNGDYLLAMSGLTVENVSVEVGWKADPRLA